MYANENGILSEDHPINSAFYLQSTDGGSLMGDWILNAPFDFRRFDDVLIEIGDLMKTYILKHIKNPKLEMDLPRIISEGGISSETPADKLLFERCVNQFKEDKELGADFLGFLYLYDAQRLCASLQDTCIELHELVILFYDILNTGAFLIPQFPYENNIIRTRSPHSTLLHTILGTIFTKLSSILDYSTKLCIEIKNFRGLDSQKYMPLHSKNVMFNKNKNILASQNVDILLRDCELVSRIQSVRNHIIHDGTINESPNVYVALKAGKELERFILFPDMTNGIFDTYRNRKTFFGKETKANLLLAGWCKEFCFRFGNTLHEIKTLAASKC